MRVGCHLSVAKGFYKMGKDAISIGANTFQFFSRNPRGSSVKELDLNDINKFKQLMDSNDIKNILAHAPYTMNMSSKDENTREFAKKAFLEDLKRLEKIPCFLYNMHPGSHVGQGVEKGIEHIVSIINETLFENFNGYVLLETMSGKGTEIGSNFKELAKIINNINLKEKVGVCLDTCHVYSAGYDIVNSLDIVLEEFDKELGIESLKAIHLNDSLTPFFSKKDRHEKLGKGSLGKEAIINFVNHPQIKKLPIFLETPNELDGYKNEIEFLRKNIK